MYASFASLGNVVLAEPGALIGFAGPRIVERTIRQPLPSNFQTSEFALENGMIDCLVPRQELRSTLRGYCACTAARVIRGNGYWLNGVFESGKAPRRAGRAHKAAPLVHR